MYYYLIITTTNLKKLRATAERGEETCPKESGTVSCGDELNRRRVDVRLVYDGSPSIEEKALAGPTSLVLRGRRSKPEGWVQGCLAAPP